MSSRTIRQWDPISKIFFFLKKRYFLSFYSIIYINKNVLYGRYDHILWIFVSNNIILRRTESLLETVSAFSSFLTLYFDTEAKMQDSILLSMPFTIGLSLDSHSFCFSQRKFPNWVWWHMPRISKLGIWRQINQEFRTRLSYRCTDISVCFYAILARLRPCLRKETKNIIH